MQRENGVASTLYSLGMLSHMEGDDVDARERYRQALAIFQRLKDRRQIAYVLSGIATLLAHEENRADAAALQGYIKGVLDELGSPLTGVELDDYRLGAETLAAAMGAEGYKKSFDEGGTLTVERAIELALTAV